MRIMDLFAGTPAYLSLVVVVLCLLLVVFTLATLFVLYRRTRQAERQVREISCGVSERLDTADKRVSEVGTATREEIHAAMQGVNESVTRMMGEMLRTQQGHMDALGSCAPPTARRRSAWSTCARRWTSAWEPMKSG